MSEHGSILVVQALFCTTEPVHICIFMSLRQTVDMLLAQCVVMTQVNLSALTARSFDLALEVLALYKIRNLIIVILTLLLLASFLLL